MIDFRTCPVNVLYLKKTFNNTKVANQYIGVTLLLNIKMLFM